MDAIKNALSSASESISQAVAGAVERPLLAAAESAIEKNTGMKIEVETENVPDDWRVWMSRTGINSIANDDTWAFLEPSQWNQRKIDLFKERAINKIILSVKPRLEDDDDDWIVAEPQWETGSKTLKLVFYPRAGRWESSNSWLEPGYKSWWNLSDEIVFGLQLYQLPGKCFYKSDWLDEFEDVDPDGLFPGSTKKFKRWFQFRHWIIYWYPSAMWGWNWQYTQTPPKMADGSLFNLDAVLKLPSMPSLSLPSVKLPSLPNVSLPSLPDAPSLPSISAPSLSAPSLSAPSLGSLPSLPEKKVRPKGRWSCHGYIELADLKVKASGRDVILSNAKITNFWEKNNYIDFEVKEHARLVLKATDDEQAKSWKESLMESGVEEGDMGGCCTVA